MMNYRFLPLFAALLCVVPQAARAQDAAPLNLDLEALRAVYATHESRQIWDGPSAKVLLDVFEKSNLHGLQPQDYHVAEIRTLLGGKDVQGLDFLLTDGLMRYISDLQVGRVSPRQIKGETFTKAPTIDPVAVVNSLINAPDLSERLAHLADKSPVYEGLVKVLAKLREIEAAGGWPQLPDGPKIEPGKSSPRVVILRQRLAATGELGEAKLEGGPVYDKALVAAVSAYQLRHGLVHDGVVGHGTRDMLNITVAERIAQVKANMERLRWQPDDLGARYIYVNIPAYQLVAASNGKVDLNMKVVVGRPVRPTPIFSDLVRMVEFNPSWHVPPTIVREDILPHLYENPMYALEHKNVHFFRDGVEVNPATINWRHENIRKYRLTAPPGPRNPLGTVKFLFPNQFDVYLHDTSEPLLFAKDERALSSGCVRVSDPPALTNWVLGGDQENWSDERRTKILESEKQTRFILHTPIPVYLAYLTAWMGDDGLPVFRPDIYGHDTALAAELAKAEAAPRKLIVGISRLNAAVGQPAVSEEEKAAP